MVTISNVQVLYFQYQISKNLYQDKGCLQKILAHQQLYIQLQLFAINTDKTLSRNREAVDQAIKEALN